MSPIKYRIEFKYSSDWHTANSNSIAFRGIQLSPLSAYEEVKSVLVKKALLQIQHSILFQTLAPYGQVISIQHLKVEGFDPALVRYHG